MFAADRVKKIKDILNEYGHIDMNSLCSLLGCSMATVRRDLDRLEEEGFLKKAYGGAIINDNPEAVSESAEYGKSDPHLKEKIQIALIAAEMISNDDIIFLGPGNTCYQVAKCLRDKDNMTIVTNNLNIVMELSGLTNMRIILLGGDITGQNNSVFTVGQYAENNLKGMFINKAIFSVDGISMKYGCTINKHEFALLMKSIIHRSNETIIVVDESKFDKRAFVNVLDITEIKKLITNNSVSKEYKEFLFNNKVELFTTFEDI